MELLIIFVLTIFNGIFAMSEASVIASRKARLQQQVEKGDEAAQAALDLAENPNRFLSTVQIGITLIGQVSGAFAGVAIAEDLAEFFVGTPLEPYAQALGFGLIVLLTTYLSLIIGELVPKRLALQYPERIAKIVAPPMAILSKITSPIVWFLGVSTNAVLFILGVRASDEPPVTEDEITQMVRQGVDAGVFLETEHEMLEGVFRLDVRRVASLMTPRTEVVWLNLEDDEADTRAKITDTRFSRYPICEGDLDHVIGVLATKDLLGNMLAGKPFDIRAVMREPLFVPESMNASKLLELFREKGKHSAFVIGEYGGFEGMITIQDILEDIVGDIDDPQIVEREDGSWLIDGLMPIDDFKDITDIDEMEGEHESFETLGGFVLTNQGKIPKTGDTFEWNGFKFEVIDMDGNRIDKMLVTPPPPEPDDDKKPNKKDKNGDSD